MVQSNIAEAGTVSYCSNSRDTALISGRSPAYVRMVKAQQIHGKWHISSTDWRIRSAYSKPRKSPPCSQEMSLLSLLWGLRKTPQADPLPGSSPSPDVKTIFDIWIWCLTRSRCTRNRSFQWQFRWRLRGKPTIWQRQHAIFLSTACSTYYLIHQTWGGGSDSYFEYLIKYARLSNTDNPVFADTWKTAVDSSIKTLLKVRNACFYNPSSVIIPLIPSDYGLLIDFDSGKPCLSRWFRWRGAHPSCRISFSLFQRWKLDIWFVYPPSSYLVGMAYAVLWNTGGKVLNNQTIVNIGLELVDACWNTYAGTAYVFPLNQKLT